MILKKDIYIKENKIEELNKKIKNLEGERANNKNNQEDNLILKKKISEQEVDFHSFKLKLADLEHEKNFNLEKIKELEQRLLNEKLLKIK